MTHSDLSGRSNPRHRQIMSEQACNERRLHQVDDVTNSELNLLIYKTYMPPFAHTRNDSFALSKSKIT